MDTADRVLKRLRLLGNKKNREGMARFGIKTSDALGISIPSLRNIAKEIGVNHDLALSLWKSGVHEARLLAIFIDDPSEVTARQMDRWAAEFDSWDICDQCCGFLFDRTEFAFDKADEWSRRSEEYVKRAGFALMAALSVHDKKAQNEVYEGFLTRIIAESNDGRNFVKKAANWALRQIGKRNIRLNKKAVVAAREIHKEGSKSSRWVASDALRELTNPRVIARIKARGD